MEHLVDHTRVDMLNDDFTVMLLRDLVFVRFLVLVVALLAVVVVAVRTVLIARL